MVDELLQPLARRPFEDGVLSTDYGGDEASDRFSGVVLPTPVFASNGQSPPLESLIDLFEDLEDDTPDETAFDPPTNNGDGLFDTNLSAKGGNGGSNKDDTTKGAGKFNDGGTTKGGGGGNGNGNGSAEPALTEYTSGGDAATSYNIEVIFVGDWTLALQQAVIDAADYLSNIILSDIVDYVGSGGFLIDDLRINATLEPIDGTGGILGEAGPTWFRLDGSFLPVEAEMTFDSADAEAKLSSGLWDEVVLHEIIHALGFGIIWDALGLTTGSVAEDDYRFIGENAIAAYNFEFTDIADNDPDSLLGVPIETDGGLGTAGGHWDEAILDNELMTGYIDGSNYLSDTTIAALEDMGYETVF
jgi:hypothetical protein